MIVVNIRYDNGERRRIGWIEGDTFISKRSVKKHLFRGGRETVREARRDGVSAWGLDCKVCDGLIERGVVWFEIRTGKKTYRCKLEDMKKKGFVLHIKPHRPQYFLLEQEFEQIDTK